jgi:hypothetical protein
LTTRSLNEIIELMGSVRVTDDDMLTRLAEVWATRWDGRFQFQVRDGSFYQDQDEGLEVLVFSVTPTKVLAFSRGAQNTQNSHTMHRF